MCQINWSLSKQELLFSDFCEDSDNIEEGAEYNKVLCLLQNMSRGCTVHLLLESNTRPSCYMITNSLGFFTDKVYYKVIQVFSRCIFDQSHCPQQNSTLYSYILFCLSFVGCFLIFSFTCSCAALPGLHSWDILQVHAGWWHIWGWGWYIPH